MSALPSHLELVQGVVLPKPVGADPVLDFCNTRSEWVGREPARSEWLTSYQAFVIWSGYVGLLSDATVFRLVEQAAVEPTDTARRFHAAREFRADLYDILTDSSAADAFDAVAAVVDRATARRHLAVVPAELEPRGGQGLRASWQLPEDLALPLDRIALLAADLLTGETRDSVKVCRGDNCGWLFLDPRGRRRWCNMATCGNRAKVRAHAARTR